MSKRQILYIVLSFILTTLLLLVIAVAVVLLQKPKVQIVWTQAQQQAVEQKRKKGKWEGKEAVAIKHVQALQVPKPEAEDDDKKRKRRDEPPEMTSLGELAQGGFFEQTFQTQALPALGWEARYLRDAYYFVSYERSDGLVNVGPVWLVDVGSGKVMPKNAMAQAALFPSEAKPADHFERERQVVGAVSNHTFPSGINLGGVMLIHFSRLQKQSAAPQDAPKDAPKDAAPKEAPKPQDSLIGWTILHDYGDTYRAYFQWIEGGEPTYADFEFDYANKRLRARNLQASNLMGLGQSFEATERVGIMPSSYNPDATEAADRWTGNFRKACATTEYKAQCKATDQLLQDKAMIAAVEWLLTFKAESIEEFNLCKQPQEGAPPRCSFAPTQLGENLYSIKYNYDLKSTGKGEIAWEIDLKKGVIIPRNPLAELAFRAVHTRTGLNL
jgi:hypothetical protein